MAQSLELVVCVSRNLKCKVRREKLHRRQGHTSGRIPSLNCTLHIPFLFMAVESSQMITKVYLRLGASSVIISKTGVHANILLS